jgi:hypothetical protein
MDAQVLRTKLKLVPDKIKEWFGSDETTNRVSDLNQRFHLSGNGLAKLLFLLEVQELEPQYFTWELSTELGLDRDRAKLISAEAEKSILEPIREDLKAYGIETKDLLLFEVPSVIRKEGDKYTSVPIAQIPQTAPSRIEQIPKPVLMKETPGPAILLKEDIIPKPAADMPRPIPKPGASIPKPSAPIPKPEAKMPLPGIPKPAAPSRPQVLSPFGFQKEARPLNTPSEFKLGGIPKPSMANTTPAPTPSKPARVELGREEAKAPNSPQTKVAGREPIHYSEPKSVFMPTKKVDLPLPSYPRPVPDNKPKNAVPNPTIH